MTRSRDGGMDSRAGIEGPDVRFRPCRRAVSGVLRKGEAAAASGRRSVGGLQPAWGSSFNDGITQTARDLPFRAAAGFEVAAVAAGLALSGELSR